MVAKLTKYSKPSSVHLKQMHFMIYKVYLSKLWKMHEGQLWLWVVGHILFFSSPCLLLSLPRSLGWLLEVRWRLADFPCPVGACSLLGCSSRRSSPLSRLALAPWAACLSSPSSASGPHSPLGFYLVLSYYLDSSSALRRRLQVKRKQIIWPRCPQPPLLEG